MAKQVFAVILDEPSEEVAERIQKEYPVGKSYRHTDLLHLVVVEPEVLTRLVATKIGIRGDNENEAIATGVVFKLNAAYSGYTKPGLWEWLSTVREG